MAYLKKHTVVTCIPKNPIIWKTSKTKSGRYISVCDELSLTAEALTKKELPSLIHEMTELLLADLWESENFKKFTDERCWKKTLKDKLKKVKDIENAQDLIEFKLDYEIV